MVDEVNRGDGPRVGCRKWWTALVVGIAMLTPGGADAQVRRISDAVSCPTCTIRIDTVATLRNVYYGGPATTIIRTADGDFLLSDPRERTIQKRSATGTFVRQIGRLGAGPGEYEMVRNLLLDRDGRIHVLDGSLGRKSIYSASGEFISSSPMRSRGGLGWPALLTPSGRVILNARAQVPSGKHSTLVLIDSTGDIVVSADEISGDPQASWNQERLLAMSSNDEIFVGEPYRFRVSRYNERLERLAVFELTAPWIPKAPPAGEPSTGIYEIPATPHIRALWVDDEGRLWVYAMVAHRDWRPGPVQARSEHLTAEQILDLARRPRFEGLVEVVDLARSRVLVRARFPSGLGQPFGGGLFSKTVDTGTSETSVVVTSLHIQR